MCRSIDLSWQLVNIVRSQLVQTFLELLEHGTSIYLRGVFFDGLPNFVDNPTLRATSSTEKYIK
jgi:hypothetical protein